MKLLTLAVRKLQKDGWIADIAERRISRILTRDLFGYIDIVAMHPETYGMIGVQVTSQSQLAKHMSKLNHGDSLENMRVWVKGGARLVLMIFKRYKDHSVRCVTYECLLDTYGQFETHPIETSVVLDNLR